MLKTRLRAWQARRKLAGLPPIAVTTAANYYQPFTAPNPDLRAVICNAAGQQVGKATYALSPLADRVYVFEVEVEEDFRRQGYATALLWHLAQTYGQPITAIKELGSASGFWHAARRWAGAGLVVTLPLSVSEMDDEAERWQHLLPVSKRLEVIIRERLFVYHEPWERAVGRGLDDSNTSS